MTSTRSRRRTIDWHSMSFSSLAVFRYQYRCRFRAKRRSLIDLLPSIGTVDPLAEPDIRVCARTLSFSSRRIDPSPMQSPGGGFLLNISYSFSPWSHCEQCLVAKPASVSKCGSILRQATLPSRKLERFVEKCGPKPRIHHDHVDCRIMSCAATRAGTPSSFFLFSASGH